jgi:hypothetical protein
MSLAPGDLLTRRRGALPGHWRQAGANGSRQPDQPNEEPAMTTFISTATTAVVVVAWGILTLSMFVAVFAAVL